MKWYEYLIIGLILTFLILVIVKSISHKIPSSCTHKCDSCDQKSCKIYVDLFKNVSKYSIHYYVYNLNIEGMKCKECESTINNIIRNNFEIDNVRSSKNDNLTIIVSKNKLDTNKLESVIASHGYIIKNITSNYK